MSNANSLMFNISTFSTKPVNEYGRIHSARAGWVCSMKDKGLVILLKNVQNLAIVRSKLWVKSSVWSSKNVIQTVTLPMCHLALFGFGKKSSFNYSLNNRFGRLAQLLLWITTAWIQKWYCWIERRFSQSGWQANRWKHSHQALTNYFCSLLQM